MAMIAMGSALGTGLFLGSGAAIGYAGPATILAFAVGSLIAATIALSMGEMASSHPVRGGFGTLAARYLSPFWGYLTRWLYWIVTVGVTAAELVACALYLNYWVPALPLWAGILLFAAVIVAINVSAVGSFGAVEFVLSSIKVIAVVVFIMIGAVLVLFGLPQQPAAGFSNFTSDGGFLPQGWMGVWLALSVVMFSFGGIELLSITAAEAKDPARSIRLAARTTVVRLAFFYVLCIGIVLALVPWREAAGTGADLASSPFVMVFDRVGVTGAAHLTNLIVLIAALSAANANLYAGSRMLHSLAADGLAPRLLSATSHRGVPLAGIAASSVGILVAAMLAFTGVGDVFNYMMSFVVFSVLLVWALILITYLAFRGRGERGLSFRMPGGRAAAVGGVIGVVLVFSTVLVRPEMTLSAAVGIPAVLVVAGLYALLLRGRIKVEQIDEAFREAELLREAPAGGQAAADVEPAADTGADVEPAADTGSDAGARG